MQEIISQVIEQIRGVWRFRWRALLMAWFVAIAGWAFVYTMPDIYKVSARVAVDTESALRPLLRGQVVANNMMSEVELMSRALMSRPRLEAVARETDLDLRASTPLEFEGLLDGMRSNIRLSREPSRENLIFNISFTDIEPNMAYEVVSELLESFVSETVEVDREGRQRALRFLQDKLAEYERQLNKAEEELANFQRENVGRMPGEEGDYYNRLEGALSQEKRIRAALRIARERRDLLSRRIAGEEAVFGLVSGPRDTSVPTSVDEQIASAEQDLQALRLRFTDKHPDVIALQARLEQLREQQAQERAVAAEVLPANDGADNSNLALNPVYQEMRIQLTTAELEVTSLEARLRQQEAEIEELRAEVDTLPAVEAEYKRLTRDLGAIRSNYQDYKQRVEMARTTIDVEDRGDEVQFRVLEPPKAPLVPDGPNRPLLLSVVLAGALGAGAGVAFVLHQLNPVFGNRYSLEAITGRPVLGSVSLMQTPAERFRLHTQTALFGVGVAILMAAWVGTVVFEEEGVEMASRVMAEVAR